jgi:hypothetical protein
MQYLRSYLFIFDSPKWALNLLLGSLCLLIPAIGGLLVQGYCFEVIEALHRRRRDTDYPEFTFEKFVPYLVRGLWPFLVSLVIMVPLGFLFFITFIGIGVASGAMAGGGRGPAGDAAGVMVLLLYLGFFAFLVLVSFVTMPLMLRAGLIQDFAPAFSLAFAQDFLGKMWVEMLLATLFLWVTSPLVLFAGLLVLCVGYIPAAMMILLAQHHLWYQLYELYLRRGGQPIPLKPEGRDEA